MVVLRNLTTLCTDLDPQVKTPPELFTFTCAGVSSFACFSLSSLQIAAALAGNLASDVIDVTIINTLGDQCAGLSTGQLQTIKPAELMKGLPTLARVSGWNPGQAQAIVKMLLSSGLMKVCVLYPPSCLLCLNHQVC